MWNWACTDVCCAWRFFMHFCCLFIKSRVNEIVDQRFPLRVQLCMHSICGSYVTDNSAWRNASKILLSVVFQRVTYKRMSFEVKDFGCLLVWLSGKNKWRIERSLQISLKSARLPQKHRMCLGKVWFLTKCISLFFQIHSILFDPPSKFCNKSSCKFFFTAMAMSTLYIILVDFVLLLLFSFPAEVSHNRILACLCRSVHRRIAFSLMSKHSNCMSTLLSWFRFCCMFSHL